MCRIWGSTNVILGDTSVGETGEMSKENDLVHVYEQEYWVREGNGRLMGEESESDKLRPKMGDINKEMASSKEGTLLEEPSDWKYFGINF